MHLIAKMVKMIWWLQWTILVAVISILALSWVISYNWQNLTPGLIITSLVVLLAILAVIFIGTVNVKESTTMFIMRFGAFNRPLFQKKDWELDDDCNLVPKGMMLNEDDELVSNPHARQYEEDNILGFKLGGLRFYIKFVEEVYEYTWTFIKSNPDGTIKLRPDEVVNFIFTGQDYGYGLQMMGKDVVDKDKVPVESSFTLIARIINPRKALFDVNHWFETFLSLVEPVIRDYINAHTYAEMIADAHLSANIFAEFSKDTINSEEKGVHGNIIRISVIDVLKKRYGVDLRAIKCRGIKLAGDYQDAQTEKWKADRDAERDAAKRLGSTTNPFLAMLAKEVALKPEELDKILKNPTQAKKFRENNKEVIERCERFIRHQIDSDAGALRSYRFEGGSAGMDLIALLGQTFGDALRGRGASERESDAPKQTGPKAKKKKKNAQPPQLPNEEDDDEDEDIDESKLI